MRYTLDTILKKMGVTEPVIPGQMIPYDYEEDGQMMVGGFAVIQLSEDGRVFTAELQHWKAPDLEEDIFEQNDDVLGSIAETFFLRALKIGDSNEFAVMALSIDGEDYFDPNNDGLIELGFSIFHSRITELQTKMLDAELSYAEDRLAARLKGLSPDVAEAIENSSNVVMFPTLAVS